MLKLIIMNNEEFDNYMENSIVHYAKELVNSGAYKEEDSLKVSKETFNRFLPDALNTKRHNIMNILNEHGEKIGMIWYGPKGNQDSDEAFIYDFSISEDFRGKGYGKECLSFIEDEAKNNNFNKISLHVFGHNKRAIGLYKKMGYEPFSMHMSKEIK
ncbi:GNAT family N-acetyltransferase [Clostridium sp. D2Q-11]|uniref:GNAT family N-acetyltransferase n=1 Tax=Anaeromonas frigoriresistens TaxID=2683708 RepID=A0A942Z9C9_9FIRM|nr:GNAT family N-acetyltransferase [Anaeromonas frigoriresistens]MBS4538745.1 GNAT family N-acetyltransferase [Anaeromonas frigoriresistens]